MYKRPLRSDELYHWGSRNGSHRYIAKIGEGKDARYFYTQEEIQAYKNESFNSGMRNKSERSKESRIEERGPRVAKTRSQSAEEARNEQRSARSHETNSATRDRLRSAKEDRSLNNGGSKSTVTSSKSSTSKSSSSPNLKDVADDTKKAVKNASDSISERAKSLKNVSEKAKRKAKKAKKKIDKFLNPGITVEHHTRMGH